MKEETELVSEFVKKIDELLQYWYSVCENLYGEKPTKT